MSNDTQRLIDSIRAVSNAYHDGYVAGDTVKAINGMNAVDRLTFYVRGLLDQINDEWGTGDLKDDDEWLVDFRRMIEAVHDEALTAMKIAVHRLPYEIDDGFWIDRDDVDAIVEALKLDK